MSQIGPIKRRENLLMSDDQMDGWKDGWMDGRMDGHSDHYRTSTRVAVLMIFTFQKNEACIKRLHCPSSDDLQA